MKCGNCKWLSRPDMNNKRYCNNRLNKERMLITDERKPEPLCPMVIHWKPCEVFCSNCQVFDEASNICTKDNTGKQQYISRVCKMFYPIVNSEVSSDGKIKTIVKGTAIITDKIADGVLVNSAINGSTRLLSSNCNLTTLTDVVTLFRKYTWDGTAKLFCMQCRDYTTQDVSSGTNTSICRHCNSINNDALTEGISCPYCGTGIFDQVNSENAKCRDCEGIVLLSEVVE